MDPKQLNRLSYAIAREEGFYVTADQARARRMRYPTRAQKNCNPGNIRRWKTPAGSLYPITAGYVDFETWAASAFPDMPLHAQREAAVEEGFRVLRVLIGQYAAGKYTGGEVPTLREMFRRYAPTSDKNAPDAYAEHVAKWLGVTADTRMDQLDSQSV